MRGGFVTPSRVLAAAAAAAAVFASLAALVPADVLRDVFNSLAFGAAIVIAVTWARAAAAAIREDADSGEWQLILAIFMVWTVVLVQRTYVIVFNLAGRPEGWAQSAVSALWPYLFTIAAMLFLAAPGVEDGRLARSSLRTMLIAVGLGALVAGILIGASISTV